MLIVDKVILTASQSRAVLQNTTMLSLALAKPVQKMLSQKEIKLVNARV